MIMRIIAGNDATGKTGGSLISHLDICGDMGKHDIKSQSPVEHSSTSSVMCHTVIPECHLDGENFLRGVSLEQQKPPPSETHPQRCLRPGQQHHVRP